MSASSKTLATRMARRTKEDTQITINHILDVATEQLLTLGYENMSYTTLSEQSGVSRTGISHHFGKKTDIPLALQGRFLKMLVDALDFSEGERQFLSSWHSAMETRDFRAIWRLVFHMTICEQQPSYIDQIRNQLDALAKAKFTYSCAQNIERLIGLTLIRLNQA